MTARTNVGGADDEMMMLDGLQTVITIFFKVIFENLKHAHAKEQVSRLVHLRHAVSLDFTPLRPSHGTHLSLAWHSAPFGSKMTTLRDT